MIPKIGFWQSGQRATSQPDDARAREDRATADLRAFRKRSNLSKADASLLLNAYEQLGQGWFWATDAAGCVTYLSEQIVAHLTDAPAALIGSPFAELFVKSNNAQDARRSLPFLLTKQSKFEKIMVRTTTAHETRLWSLSAVPQFDKHGRFTGFRGNGVDITEQRKSSEHASRLARYDTLTGLPNRLRMSEVLENALNAGDGQQRRCAVMMLDLDRFKQVNDTLGHPAGDALLKQVADRILRIVGDSECVFRLGGDEFQIVLRDCGSQDAVRATASGIIDSLSAPYIIEGSRCVIGVSIGIAVSPPDERDGTSLIRNADLALYAAKGDGRGCVRFFSKDLLQAADDRRILEEDLRDALGKGQLQVHYQPVVNATTNLTTGVEALVRWQHPTRGEISPALFIPIAEEASLIAPLGEWILRKACEDAAGWPGRLRVAVNVSPLQFVSGTLPAIVTSALAASGLSPDRLELEITEGVFISDAAAADTVFASLKQIGVRLALDDFGTGYSSLGYLRTAPFDKIKIDQSFVRAATLPGSRNAAIIGAIVALADALNMETTAEGVEYRDQLALVQSLGVSHVQGHIYSAAISSDDLATRLTDGDWEIVPSGLTNQRSTRISMYRTVRAIFGNHCRQILIRNLSETGALVEGLDDVPFGSDLIVDFGEGHLVFASVVRSRAHQQGLQFEAPMVSDGRGGLNAADPVSAYTIQAAGLPAPSGKGLQGPEADNSDALLALRTRLGLALPDASLTANNHCSGHGNFASRDLHQRPLTPGELARLEEAAEASANPQLKHIVALLILTRVRQRDLLGARWEQFDLDQGIWTIPSAKAGNEQRVKLSSQAIQVMRQLPRWEHCPFILANPSTQKPYQSFQASWDTARLKADLADVEIDDLRFCGLPTARSGNPDTARLQNVTSRFAKRLIGE